MNSRSNKHKEFFIDSIEIPHSTLQSFHGQNNIFGPFDTPCKFLKVGAVSIICYQPLRVKRLTGVTIFERTNIPLENILNLEIEKKDLHGVFAKGKTKRLLHISYLKNTNNVYTLTIVDVSKKLDSLYSMVYDKMQSLKHIKLTRENKNDSDALAILKTRYVKGEITKEEFEKLKKNTV
jgi:hypothetical protein